MEKRLQCTTCQKVTYASSTEMYLNLRAPVDSKVEKGTEVDIEACFEKFFADSVISDVVCPGCNAKTEWTQR